MPWASGEGVAQEAPVRDLEECALLSRLRDRTIEVCLLCAGLGLCALCVPSILGGTLVLATAIAVAAGAGIPLRVYLRTLVGAAGFAFLSLAPLSAAVHLHAPHFTFDPDGFQTGIVAGFRAIGTLSATLLLSSATPFHRVVSLLRRMRMPILVVDLLSLVHREIFLLDETFGRLRSALACRGGWTSARSSLRCLALGAAALLPLSLARAARLEEGLASRGAVDGEVRYLDDESSASWAAILLSLLVPAMVATAAFLGGRRFGL